MLFANFRSAVADFISPELKHERRSLERLAETDALTGLANRAAFEKALPAAEADAGVAVILFDANNFGKLNKIAGQRFGDVALREIAECLLRAAGVFKVGERVFRIGGDEFVIFAPVPVARAVRDAAEAYFGIRFAEASVSISGTIGDTYGAADACLQFRKAERKGNK